MIDYFRQILTTQFEASLSMLNLGIQNCPPEHWEGKIASSTFRQIAYHTLFFVDVYLSPTEESFVLRELHQRGGDELWADPCVGLPKDETLSYLLLCRQKMIETLAAETEVSLTGPSGFSYRRFSRGELHLYNIRHIQHHAGQMSAYLRRVADQSTPWVGSGWRG